MVGATKDVTVAGAMLAPPDILSEMLEVLLPAPCLRMFADAEASSSSCMPSTLA
jgi:hypothetical protein